MSKYIKYIKHIVRTYVRVYICVRVFTENSKYSLNSPTELSFRGPHQGGKGHVDEWLHPHKLIR